MNEPRAANEPRTAADADHSRMVRAGQKRGWPWAGLAASMLAVALQHQGIGDALHFSCGFDARAADVVLGVVALVLLAIGALLSWRALETDATRRFAAQTSLGVSALFALMVVWQTIAGIVLVPPCMP